MPTTRRKSKLMKYLPKAASAVSFQNPIFSPGREKQRLNSSSGFSGPIVSIIPDEARRRPRKEREEDGAQEPSSPKVSCIGQIKLHKDKNKSKKKMIALKKSASHSHKHHHHVSKVKHDHDQGHDQRKKEEAKEKKQDSKILKIFGFGSRKRNNNKAASSVGGAGEFGGSSPSEPLPSVGHMKRFASGRQTLANFDWTAQIAPLNDLDDRNFHSDEELGRYNSDSEGEEEEIIIPFSAPILRGGGLQEPRKEVNLWQRRNTTSPPPLQIKPIKIRAE